MVDLDHVSAENMPEGVLRPPAEPWLRFSFSVTPVLQTPRLGAVVLVPEIFRQVDCDACINQSSVV